MPVERIYADPHVKADVGLVALQRGPVVYCLEGVDNDGNVRNLILPRNAKLTATFDKNLLGGLVVIRSEALAALFDDDNRLHTRIDQFQAVPYSTWDNRKPGPMVGLAERPNLVELPSDQGTLARGVRIRGSHLNGSDTLKALNDEVTPKSSNDQGISRG